MGRLRQTWPLLVIILLGLGLRLLAWHWREFYPLGGDEHEYLDQAIRLLRDHEYVELRLMRPPLYPLFLAGWIYLIDSLVQNLRLVQAIISAATIPLVYLLTSEVAQQNGHTPRRPALLAALLTALSYTLAANATELLTEALFLCGLSAVFWLVLRAARTSSSLLAGVAGLIIGALCLVRSVALPLLPLGAVWLVLAALHPPLSRVRERGARGVRAFLPALTLALACCLVLLPWSTRNYLTYGGLILIDTTGAENLWLDNDPAGREAVKAQLYAMGEDRLGRQQIATQRGMAVIQADPGRFLHKAGGELKKLFALEFSDDMLARPAIWVRPLEVWVRLGLGDGLWLLILLAGVIGMGQRTTQGETPRSVWTWFLHTFSQPRWLLLPWVLYVALTTLIFHVELRYRLPLYPALLAYSGLVLTSRQRPAWPGLLAALLCLSITLLHANYPALAWQLANKHLQLARAEAALNRGDAVAAEAAAQSAITWDNDSALAQVALARAAMARGENQAAMVYLDTAIKLLPAHPYAHLLRGDLLRSAGESASARSDLAYETSALEDLQSWAWQRFVSPSPSQISLGDGLDLGFIRGFHHLATGETGFRWSHGTAYVRLHAAAGANQIQIQAASGRPDGSATRVQVRVDGRVVGAIMVSAAGDTYHLNLPQPISSPGDVVISLESPTFTPRDYDRASGDGRRLGVQVYSVGL